MAIRGVYPYATLPFFGSRHTLNSRFCRTYLRADRDAQSLLYTQHTHLCMIRRYSHVLPFSPRK